MFFEKDRMYNGITKTLKVPMAKKVQSAYRSKLGVIDSLVATICTVCLSENICQGIVIIVQKGGFIKQLHYGMI